MARDDGGPAFPVPATTVARVGMSLRDYFAGQALAGALVWAAIEGDAQPAEDAPTIIGTKCYEIADAMLAAREKEPTP